MQVHARNKPMAEEVDYGAVAEMTDGMVGAQLANILDVAALSVLRDSRNEVRHNTATISSMRFIDSIVLSDESPTPKGEDHKTRGLGFL